jgi:hypothetical protein
MLKRSNRLGRNDWHHQAAEFHDLAAHAHRMAAVHHGKEDHRRGHELSKQAMEFAVKAHRLAEEAQLESAGFLEKAMRVTGTVLANPTGKRNKKKS